MDSLSNCIAPIKNSRNIRWDRSEYAEKLCTLEKLGLSLSRFLDWGASFSKRSDSELSDQDRQSQIFSGASQLKRILTRED